MEHCADCGETIQRRRGIWAHPVGEQPWRQWTFYCRYEAYTYQYGPHAGKTVIISAHYHHVEGEEQRVFTFSPIDAPDEEETPPEEMPPVHMLKEQKGREITTKCGKILNRDKDMETATAWWQQVTCEECK